MHFITDWYSVKAGTEVRLVRETSDLAGNPLLVVERLDRQPIMPDIPHYGRCAYVSPEFLADG